MAASTTQPPSRLGSDGWDGSIPLGLSLAGCVDRRHWVASPPPAHPCVGAGDMGTAIAGLCRGASGRQTPSASSAGIHRREGLGEWKLGDFRKKGKK